MNNLDTTLISDPIKQQPLLGGSIAFIQTAVKEALTALALGFIGDTYNGSDAFSLYGATNLGTSYFLGYIYWNNEIFRFAGGSTSGFTNPGVFIVSSVGTAPDPITFSDLTTGSVHLTRTLLLVDQANGTGAFNLSALKFAHNPPAGTTVSVFSNSFVQQLAVVYRKNNFGLVTIQGIARKLTAATVAGQTIFTLPTGFRPISSARNLSGLVLYDTSALVSDFINVSTSGVVSISGFNTPTFTTSVDVYFTGCSFYAD